MGEGGREGWEEGELGFGGEEKDVLRDLVAVRYHNLEGSQGVFVPEKPDVGVRVIEQPYHRLAVLLPHQHVVDVGLAFMRVADPASGLELHGDVDWFLGGVLAVEELAVEEQVYLALEPEGAGADHDLALDDLLDDEGELAVGLDHEGHCLEDVAAVEGCDVVQPQSAGLHEFLERLAYQEHVVEHGIVELPDPQ